MKSLPNRLRRLLSAAVVVLVASAVTAYADPPSLKATPEPPKSIAPFAHGGVPTDDEIRAFIMHRYDEYMRLTDADKDGKPDKENDSDAVRTHLKAIRDDADLRMVDVAARAEKLGHRMSVAELDAFLISTPPRPPNLLGLRLRRNAEDLSLAASPEPFTTAQGALFSYTRDFDDDSDVWQIRGALARPIVILDKAGASGELDYWSVIPSLYVDRTTNSTFKPNPKPKETNEVTARLWTEFKVEGSGFFDAHLFRGGPSYTTDVDIESAVPAVEVEYELVSRGLAGGLFHRWGPIDVRFRPILHADYRSVVNNTGNPKLPEDDSIRLGGKAVLDVRPVAEGLNRLTVTLSYTHYWEIQQGGSHDLFEASLRYKIDEAGVFEATIDYRAGQTPLLDQDTNTLTAGLSVKL